MTAGRLGGEKIRTFITSQHRFDQKLKDSGIEGGGYHMGKLDRWLGAVVAAILLVAAVSPAGAQSPGAGPIATVSVAKDSIVWQPTVEHAGLTLTVSGPGGAAESRFPAGSAADVLDRRPAGWRIRVRADGGAGHRR